ncbi:uncharacterized protein LOC126456657 [Schistocerca serialis cubense]|uniref:uncharacterized protein LOC126456657 n=1 Tax=Schistocerca serialis cubense TaxID=2023355 RepID=UPI00214F442A|nr:uncharacterized protein LOC126456657 [Schistocerca serialis cubense]
MAADLAQSAPREAHISKTSPALQGRPLAGMQPGHPSAEVRRQLAAAADSPGVTGARVRAHLPPTPTPPPTPPPPPPPTLAQMERASGAFPARRQVAAAAAAAAAAAGRGANIRRNATPRSRCLLRSLQQPALTPLSYQPRKHAACAY